MAWQYWTEAHRQGCWREVTTPHTGAETGADGQQMMRVRTTASAVSKGTETLVHAGRVPPRVAELMAAPHQLGDFPYPVSYGYLTVGVVDEGPAAWIGRRVFGLLPHHSHHLVTPNDVHPIPEGISDHRALLAGAAETGLNILWQSPPYYGDRVAIIGAGMIGTATALLASHLPLERLEIIETNPVRRTFLTRLGLTALAPEDAGDDCDIVIHTSGSEGGLGRALEIAGDDGTIVEASWYGDTEPQVALGSDFHARRLAIVASQVGQIPAGHRARRTRSERLGAALSALHDDRFDALITGTSGWQDLPWLMDELSSDTALSTATLCHVLDYEEGS